METSNLSRLETRFFKDVLNAELNVPVRATLEYENCEFAMIVVPEIDENGYFILRYFDASECKPETQNDESGTESKSLDIGAAFGQHPELKRAWLRSDPVTLQLHTKPVLLDAMSPGVRKNPPLDARVQLPDTYHKGTLRLGNNQVTVEEATLKRAEFCIVGFPDFRNIERQANSANGSLPHVVLKTEDGYKIILTMDAEQTRGEISHTGMIEKEDGGDVGIDDLVEIFDGLTLFLSFAIGAWCYPTVVIGSNSDIRRHWGMWGEIGRFNSKRQNWHSWFDHNGTSRQGSDLEWIFPHFWKRWEEKRDEIKAVVQCYVYSNRMRETGLLGDAVAKSYAGLEMIASLVKEDTIETKSASEIASVLCDEQVPNRGLQEDRHPVTYRLCRKLGLQETKGAYLLNKVRNYVVHPYEPKTSATIKDRFLKYLDPDVLQYIYLQDLSQFYLECLFLKYCDSVFCERENWHRSLLETRHGAESNNATGEVAVQTSRQSEEPKNTGT